MEHWLRDEAVDKCMKCSVEFTFTERKHHCRNCGKIYCHRSVCVCVCVCVYIHLYHVWPTTWRRQEREHDSEDEVEKRVPRDMRPSGFCFLVYTSDPSSNLYVLYLTVLKQSNSMTIIMVCLLCVCSFLTDFSISLGTLFSQFFCVLYMYYYACSLQV